MERQSKKHPAYGLVQFSRVTGGNKRLFGSQTRPNSTITLRITPAEEIFELSHTWYFGHSIPFIEVELSPAQFAELLTTMNVGQGVPCTIKHHNGKQVEGIPEDDKPEAVRIKEDFERKTQDLSETLKEQHKEIEELLNKKTLSKEDKKKILWVLGKAHQEVSSNMPFVLEQFNKSTQKIITQAKAEVDAFSTHAIQVVGLEAIAEGRTPNFQIESKDRSYYEKKYGKEVCEEAASYHETDFDKDFWMLPHEEKISYLTRAQMNLGKKKK